MRERDVMLHFRVSQAELDRINLKRKEMGVRSMSAYLRKMAMDGYCITLEIDDISEARSLLRRCSNNLNRFARRANETGSIYAEDIADLQKRLNEIWEVMKGIMYPVQHTQFVNIVPTVNLSVAIPVILRPRCHDKFLSRS